MARTNAPDSASSQFFNVHQDSPHLDGKYACFGYVTAGMEIVEQIRGNVVNTDGNGGVADRDQPVISTITIREE
jgi:peptidyl-prolyl cis-trans isomerase B (cyclophilin B)